MHLIYLLWPNTHKRTQKSPKLTARGTNHHHVRSQDQSVLYMMHPSGALCSKLAIFHCVLVHVLCHSTCRHGDELSFSVSHAVVYTLQHTGSCWHNSHALRSLKHSLEIKFLNVTLFYSAALWDCGAQRSGHWMRLKVSVTFPKTRAWEVLHSLRWLEEIKLATARKGQLSF